MHWTTCSDDSCPTHQLLKMATRYWPKKERLVATKTFPRVGSKLSQEIPSMDIEDSNKDILTPKTTTRASTPATPAALAEHPGRDYGTHSLRREGNIEFIKTLIITIGIKVISNKKMPNPCFTKKGEEFNIQQLY